MDDALPAAPEEEDDPDGEAAAALLDPGPGGRARLAALAVEHAERLLDAVGSAGETAGMLWPACGSAAAWGAGIVWPGM